MNNQVKVSVCIPVYGVEKYIERCARSLFEQTMKEGIEFIFVNDCTKDKSIEVLERVLSEYPERKNQVKIIHRETNGGLVAARKTGLQHAAGDYIIHCDSDDWLDINMFQTLYNKAVETDADMVYCDFLQSDGKSHKVTKQLGIEDIKLLINSMLYGKVYWSLWNKMFKRDIALHDTISCPDHIKMAEDMVRVFQMLMLCKKVAYVEKSMYYYYCNPSSIVHNVGRHQIRNIIEATDIVVDLFLTQKEYATAVVCRKFDTAYSLLFYECEPQVLKEYIKPFRIIDLCKNIFRNKRIIVLLITKINYPLGRFACLGYKMVLNLMKKIK